jgi:hypothetical protein
MTTVSEVLNAALTLQANERAEVVHKLLLSLEPTEFDEDADQAWAEELRQRLLAIREGRVSLRDWNDTLADMRQSLTVKGGK